MEKSSIEIPNRFLIDTVIIVNDCKKSLNDLSCKVKNLDVTLSHVMNRLEDLENKLKESE